MAKEERALGNGGLLLYREGFKAVYRMLRAACSSSHAFRSRRRMPNEIRVSCDATAVVEVVAVVGLLCKI
jgi:hypothetical protein